MAVITDIAEAVVEMLNAGSFGQPIEAQRLYSPQFELAEMEDLHVTVVPRGVQILPGGRAHNQHDYTIDVAVQKKLSAADNAEIDTLMDLVDQIADHFRFKRLEGVPNAVWLKTEHQAIYSPEHLREMRQFTSVLTFTFRVMR